MSGDKARYGTRILSILGAVSATGLCVALSAAPANARDLDSKEWASKVSDSLQSKLRLVPSVPVAVRNEKVAIVAATFDADGQLKSTSLAAPTGIRPMDKEAMRAVGTIAFPQLPVAMRGRERLVPIEVYFSTNGSPRRHRAVRATSLDLIAKAEGRGKTQFAGRVSD